MTLAVHPIEPEPTVSFAPEDSDGTRPQVQLEAWTAEQISRGIEVHHDVLGRVQNFQGRLSRLQLDNRFLSHRLNPIPVAAGDLEDGAAAGGTCAATWRPGQKGS